VGVQGQANCLTINMVRGKSVGLRGMEWWTFQDSPLRNQYYGVVDAQLVPKTAYYAMQTLTRELNGYYFNAARTNKVGFAGIEAYEFVNGSATKTVLWSASTTTSAGWPCARPRALNTATFGAGVSKLRIIGVTGSLTVILDNGLADLDTRVGYIAF